MPRKRGGELRATTPIDELLEYQSRVAGAIQMCGTLTPAGFYINHAVLPHQSGRKVKAARREPGSKAISKAD